MPATCPFEGNSDFYGLGVRLGVYLQWLTSLGAVYFRLDGSMDLSDSYLAFEIAIMIALYVLTFTSEAAHVVEAVIMMYMTYGGFLVVKGYRASERNPSPQLWRLVVGNTATACTSVYAMWFWTVGRKSNNFQPDCARPQIFLFARIASSGFGKVSTFFAVLSGFLLLTVPLMLWHYRSLIFGRIAEVIKPLGLPLNSGSGLDDDQIIEHINSRDFHYPVVQSTSTGWRYGHSVRAVQLQYFTHRFVQIRTGLGNEERTVYIWPPLGNHGDLVKRFQDIIATAARADTFRPLESDMEVATISARLHISLERWSLYSKVWKAAPKLRSQLLAGVLIKAVPFIAFIYSILAIELTLKWNKISDVYTVHSTGQLIPFIIGVSGFVKLFLDVQHEYKQRKRDQTKKKERVEATDDVLHFISTRSDLQLRAFEELVTFRAPDQSLSSEATELHPIKAPPVVRTNPTNV